MSKNIFLILNLVLLLVSCLGKTLPSYIIPCKDDDPNLNECVISRSKDILPHLLNGDKKYHIPSFNPLELEQIECQLSNSLRILLKKVKISGFDKAALIASDINKETESMSFLIHIPRAHLKANYDVKGKILILPIEGSGPCDIILDGGKFNASFKMSNFNKNSLKPMKILSSSLDYTATKTTYDLRNLFNGNKELGDQINKLLNEEEDTLRKEFKPVIAETIRTIVEQIVRSLIEGYFYSDLLIP